MEYEMKKEIKLHLNKKLYSKTKYLLFPNKGCQQPKSWKDFDFDNLGKKNPAI